MPHDIVARLLDVLEAFRLPLTRPSFANFLVVAVGWIQSYGLHAVTEALVLAPGERTAVPTGLRVAIPEGYEGQVRPRSGWALKHGVTCLNSPGTIDSDYRGEIRVILANLGQEPVRIERGMRIVGLSWKGTRYAGGTGEPGPLSPEGRRLVPALGEAGITLDLSHTAEDSFFQAIDLLEGPVFADRAVDVVALALGDRAGGDVLVLALECPSELGVGDTPSRESVGIDFNLDLAIQTAVDVDPLDALRPLELRLDLLLDPGLQLRDVVALRTVDDQPGNGLLLVRRGGGTPKRVSVYWASSSRSSK